MPGTPTSGLLMKTFI